VLVLDGASLAKLFQALRQRQFVIPNLRSRSGPLEEEERCLDIGIGRKGAGRKAHHGMQIELLQEVTLDVGKGPAAKERPFGHDHPAAGTVAGLEPLHDVLDK